MSSAPDREANSRGRLPFEPNKTRKKSRQSSKSQPPPENPTQPAATSASSEPPAHQEIKKALAAKMAGKTTPKPTEKRTPLTQEDRAIPQDVSVRMVRRMAAFSGIPTTLGILTFVASYGIVSFTEFKLPNIAVVLTSMGCFGLGVLGLSYGVLSASWDEGRPGSLLGWEEFTANFSKLTNAWRSVKNKD